MARPDTIEALTQAIAEAILEERPLALRGFGGKEGWGRPAQAAETLDLTAFSGITLYEPEELVMRAGAGTPMAEIEAVLAENRQMLAFEPGDWAPLWGGAPGLGSIGGAFSTNLAGPRRVKAGAARDHLLGLVAVSGRAEVFKAGGRVVKNVTGYDLCKLACGAFGTLAALTEVTFKVLPAPEKTRTVLVLGLDAGAAITAMNAALNAPVEVSGAAHLPAEVAARVGVDMVAGAGAAVTALRLEGTPVSVGARCAALSQAMASHGLVEELHSERSGTFWRAVRDLAPLRGESLWRLSVPPADGASVAEAILATTGGEYLLDWGGGLIALALPWAPDAHASTVRAAVTPTGGHATLLRAPATIRAAVPVFQPQAPALAALTARVKAAFDPKGILNPGRM